GPKGVGALYVRRRDPRVRIVPLIDGGGHENGLRSGTLNVAGIVGMGMAAELAAADVADGEAEKLTVLRDRLEQELQQRTGGASGDATSEASDTGDASVSGSGGGSGGESDIAVGGVVRVTFAGTRRMPQTSSVVFSGL